MKKIVYCLALLGLVSSNSSARCINHLHKKAIEQGRRSVTRYNCPIRNSEASAFVDGVCQRCGCSLNEHNAE